jgi:DNA-binding MarR family transcriptional regulator
VTEAKQAASPGVAVQPADAVAQPTIEGISKSVWQMTEEVLELLRARSRSAVHKYKRSELLWLDDLTETQSNTVIAVRQLCDASPEGVTLKKLAETLGVTAAAASVMVDLLVKKKMLKRTKSKSDRRAVLIRLTPDTAHLFDISEQSLQETFMGLQNALGPEFLGDWQRVLVTATGALHQVVGPVAIADPDLSRTARGGGQPA